MLIQEFSNGVNSQFAKLIGVNESNIRSYLAGTQPKFDVLSAIAGKLAINCEWLLTGKGNMLKEQEQQNSSPICTDSVNIESAPTVKQLPIGEIPHTPEAIPFAEAARNGLREISITSMSSSFCQVEILLRWMPRQERQTFLLPGCIS